MINFENITKMDGTMIPRSALEFKFEERNLQEEPQQESSTRDRKPSRREGRTGKKSRRKDNGKMVETGDFPSIDSQEI
jgi:hypothetical protein